MNKLPDNFWSEFDFSDGELLYAETQLTESMLFVRYLYSENIDKSIYLNLDIGNGYDDNRGCFYIEITWDIGNKPVAYFTCKTVDSLRKLTLTALQQVHKELSENRLSYYGDIWDTISINVD